ncbi:MAG: hypothetical protein LCH51_00125 [Bacteroidetes bacterium]|nr:hypothetical protein [Bacteroidota bacterium]
MNCADRFELHLSLSILKSKEFVRCICNVSVGSSRIGHASISNAGIGNANTDNVSIGTTSIGNAGVGNVSLDNASNVRQQHLIPFPISNVNEITCRINSIYSRINKPYSSIKKLLVL